MGQSTLVAILAQVANHSPLAAMAVSYVATVLLPLLIEDRARMELTGSNKSAVTVAELARVSRAEEGEDDDEEEHDADEEEHKWLTTLCRAGAGAAGTPGDATIASAATVAEREPLPSPPREHRVGACTWLDAGL